MYSSLPAEEYQAKYGWEETVGTLEVRTKKKLLEERLAVETFRERRKLLEREIKYWRAAEELGASFITMPLKWDNSRRGFCWSGSLFIGGIEKRKTTYRTYQDDGCTFTDAHSSIYTGNLPQPVREIYTKAKEYFKVDDLFVVSRDPDLFNIVVAKLTSPLLVAHIKENQFLLLAAWDLEHDLPKELGGKL